VVVIFFYCKFFLLIMMFALLLIFLISRSVALDMPVRGSRYSGNACYVESDLTLRNLLGKNFYDVEVDIFCLTLRKIGVVVA
jgi:hypothetical protein